MLRVLVTGGAGYLGSILCEHLLGAGHGVTVLDDLRYGQSGPYHLCAHSAYQFVRGDARDETVLRPLLREVDVVVPLAAVVGAPACDRSPRDAREINRDAVRSLNRLRSRSQLIVYPNTNSGYGTATDEAVCTEESPLRPVSLYGITKVEAEAELLASPATISLRLATVFGMSSRMRIDLLVNHFVYAAVTDGYIVVFERHHRRNFVHIRDVADCFLHCIAHCDLMVGRAYNVGLDDANLTKQQLALKIREHVPKFCVEFAEIGSDPDQRDYAVSNARLRAAGFGAARSLDAGIDELVKGYQMMPRSPFGND